MICIRHRSQVRGRGSSKTKPQEVGCPFMSKLTPMATISLRLPTTLQVSYPAGHPPQEPPPAGILTTPSLLFDAS